jgi:hypothetical protein
MKALLVSALLLAPAPAGAHDATRDAAPHEGLVQIVQGLRTNDVALALRASVSAERFSGMQVIWDENRKGTADAAENMQFQAVMGMLTAPGAEDLLMAQVEPKLVEMRPQVAMVAGMLSGMGAMMVQQNTNLSPEEQQVAQRLLEAFGQHLLTHDVTSPASARKVIGIVCTTARQLGVVSLEDVQKLTFDEMLAKLGVVWGGVKSVLDVYGISIDRTLDSFQAETVSVDGDRAVVRVSFQFLGVDQTSEIELVKSGNDWFPESEATTAVAGG